MRWAGTTLGQLFTQCARRLVEPAPHAQPLRTTSCQPGHKRETGVREDWRERGLPCSPGPSQPISVPGHFPPPPPSPHLLREKALGTKLLRNPAACLHKIVSQGQLYHSGDLIARIITAYYRTIGRFNFSEPINARGEALYVFICADARSDTIFSFKKSLSTRSIV